MNNGDTPRNLSFAFASVPGLPSPAASSYCLWDVWAGVAVAGPLFGGFVREQVPGRDSVFLTLGSCL